MNIIEKIKEKNTTIRQEQGKTMSVSKCIGYCHKEFNSESIAKKCYDKGFDDPNSKYYQMDVTSILESWEAKASESRRYGSLLDSYVDLIINKKDKELECWKLDNSYDYDMRLHNLCDGFDQFYKNLSEKTDYKYVDREIPMFIKSNKINEYINGRLDCLFYSESLNKYLIIDWKTNEKIDKSNSFEKMLGPLYNKDACNLNEYSIQVFMYKKALAETYELAESNNIDVYICQFLTSPNENKLNYMLHKPIFDYDSILLDNIIEFCYKKQNIAK